MKIYNVTDPEFREYGRIIEGYDLSEILDVLNQHTPCPEGGTAYVPKEEAIQNLPSAKALASSLFGGLPVEFGWCNGHNTRLNCLEYHRNSEFNLGTEDFILILGLAKDIRDWKLDTSTCKAFKVPAGVLVEVFETALHYAPCSAAHGAGFRVLVALPDGTNTEAPHVDGKSPEDRLLRANNKWLLAHPDAPEAKDGAWIGLTGENIDLSDSI
jgi:hypothetical protein